MWRQYNTHGLTVSCSGIGLIGPIGPILLALSLKPVLEWPVSIQH